ncbi:MAG TPA: hypothetical protein VMR34_02920 [Candidatus Saccharimonadales bacterium]|nr:hypothetical protein [Candidatus Saccharimonadales bacterium]
MESTSEDDVKNTLVNPYYAINFADSLFKVHEPKIAKEDWVMTNTMLIEELGAQLWLEQLILNLVKEADEDSKYSGINPSKTVEISKRLSGEHESTIDVSGWLKANVKLMSELGTGDWLWLLLKVLQTGGAS